MKNAVALLGMLIMVVSGRSQDLAHDAKAIQGEWRCTSMVIDGEKMKLSVASRIRLTLDDKTYREHALGKELQSFTYRLLPGGLIRFDVPGVYFLGRYELKDGKLKLCFPGRLEVGKEPQPPSAFASKPGSRATLSTWERD